MSNVLAKEGFASQDHSVESIPPTPWQEVDGYQYAFECDGYNEPVAHSGAKPTTCGLGFPQPGPLLSTSLVAAADRPFIHFISAEAVVSAESLACRAGR